ncbi:hypothetical protein [Halobacteriovorax sp.]|uniref:hypothetical protein n=1 Tax=Halobacteriovorax sp. TaxID=2020862 RepID=UPI003AF26911
MKKILIIAALSLPLINANANFFLPEISRDGKTLNTSVLAVSGEARNFAGATYDLSMFKQDDDSSIEYDISTPGAFGAFSAKGFSAQLETKFSQTEIDDQNSSAHIASLLTGYRVNKMMTLGLGYTQDEFDAGVDAQKLEAGGTLTFDGVLFGGSVAYREVDDKTLEGGYFILTAGMGQREKNDVVEAGVQLMTEGSDDLTRGKRFSVFSNMTKLVGSVEIDGSFKFGFGNYYKDDGGTTDGNNFTSLEFDIDGEFLVLNNFYITPGLSYASSNAPGVSEDTSLVKLGSDFGYRNAKLDATLAVDYIFISEKNEVDYDGLGFGLNIAYLF